MSYVDFASTNERGTEAVARNYAWNATVNHARIRQECQSGVMDFRSLPRAQEIVIHDKTGPKRQTMPALIVGSGPTLDDVLPRIGQWKGIIFAAPSVCKVMDQYGRLPHYVVAVDASRTVADELHGPIYWQTTLITHQSVAPEVLEEWKGPKVYFRHYQLGQWGDMQAALYPWLTTVIPIEGCVVNTMVQIAHLLGYSPIVMVGNDMCFMSGKTRVTEAQYHGAYRYFDALNNKIDLGDRPFVTTEAFLFYHKTLLLVWKRHKMRLISASARHILKEPEWISYDDMFDLKWPSQPREYEKWVDEQVDKEVEAYGIGIDPNGNTEFARDLVIAKERLVKQMEWVDGLLAHWEKQEDGSWRRK